MYLYLCFAPRNHCMVKVMAANGRQPNNNNNKNTGTGELLEGIYIVLRDSLQRTKTKVDNTRCWLCQGFSSFTNQVLCSYRIRCHRHVFWWGSQKVSLSPLVSILLRCLWARYQTIFSTVAVTSYIWHCACSAHLFPIIFAWMWSAV